MTALGQTLARDSSWSDKTYLAALSSAVTTALLKRTCFSLVMLITTGELCASKVHLTADPENETCTPREHV